MTKPHMTQSQKRFVESVGALFDSNHTPISGKKPFLFLKSSSDEGVIRNGGRNGARLAPQSLLSQFKKLNQNDKSQNYHFYEVEVSSSVEEKAHFHEAQLQESARIKACLKNAPNAQVCHVGGGHDHIYPLLRAYSHFEKIIVLNIDAHADTRTDEEFHSGTPFRQFSNEHKNFHLFQIGLHSFANSLSTLSPLSQPMPTLWKKDVSNPALYEAFFQNLKAEITPQTLVIFSLDADALVGSEVPGVSAVNANGLTQFELKKIWNSYQSLVSHESIMGIYELNPVYDTLSMISMRTVAGFIYETL